MFQKKMMEGSAASYGLEVVAVESYRQDDADLSVQFSKMHAAGARAVMKIGSGGTTLTAAKDIKQLGLDMLLFAAGDDVGVFRTVAETMGDGKFFFVATPPQVYETLPDGPLKAEITKFLPLWTAKFAGRDPVWASRGWDAVRIAKQAVEQAKSIEGPKLRDALEQVTGLQGTASVYNMTAENHSGITVNPLYLVTLVGGKVKVVY